jgi:hypothetical protein
MMIDLNPAEVGITLHPACKTRPPASNTRLPHILSIGLDGVDADVLLASLDLSGLAVSSGSACHTGTSAPSHVLLAMGLQYDAALRFSLGWTTTEAEVEKAILKSSLGLTPTSDGRVLKIPIPPLTEERRKQLVRLVKKLNEDCKVAMRNVRRDGNDDLKDLEKEKKISEDELRRAIEFAVGRLDLRLYSGENNFIISDEAGELAVRRE